MSATTNVDLDALLDLSEFDNNYNSPPLSPSTTAKSAAYSSPVSVSVPTPGLSASTPQTLSGPSHKYDLYRQQTGLVPGAIANTMAVNQSSNAGYQDFASLAYLSLPEEQAFNFNTSPAQPSMDLDFCPAADQLYSNTVNPSNIENDSGSGLASPASTSGSVGRLWPGAHSHAALVKAQAQQAQQQAQQHAQQHAQQQQQQQQRGLAQSKSRGKSPRPTDPLVEQKIAQVLNSMRATPSAPEPPGRAHHSNLPRSRKDEDDMDEDERLLASEEGKKLSSKERRQLRNKVSARAFRSRRKEYISQLEAEIAIKVNENGHLRSKNCALMEENKRLADLTRMLLSSASFSNFLDHLSTNPQATQVKMEPQHQQPPPSHVPKDVNPNSGQQAHQHQIGMAMIPEQTMDMSMLSLDSAAAYNFQPQVFVVDTPEPPFAVDVSVLSGKTTTAARDEDPAQSDQDGKVVVIHPALDRPKDDTDEASEREAVDDEFERDPDYALFHTESPPPRSAATSPEPVEEDGPDISGDATPSRPADEEPQEVMAAQAASRVRRIRAELEPLISRLELLTTDL
ncbi:ribonuclease Z [Ophiocordyceps camponoti-floridani]|uniref:Ribonuclease Z n=1 Tax=Ophiocordyceps camponoti-floridani TaxID=2030778 RepID=A0A8H4QDQ9_9HYPO|nr:ribonuclease Z [Ophiocordyceps camponoti-floridani]